MCIILHFTASNASQTMQTESSNTALPLQKPVTSLYSLFERMTSRSFSITLVIFRRWEDKPTSFGALASPKFAVDLLDFLRFSRIVCFLSIPCCFLPGFSRLSSGFSLILDMPSAFFNMSFHYFCVKQRMPQLQRLLGKALQVTPAVQQVGNTNICGRFLVHT